MLLVLVFCVVARVLTTAVPEPYMDEIFHVPQTQQYCRGEWAAWDPMITTFPGVYVFSTAIARAAARAAGAVGAETVAAAACETAGLRLCNIIFAMGSYFCSRRILRLKAAGAAGAAGGEWSAVTLAFFPLQFFFVFLFVQPLGRYCNLLSPHIFISVSHGNGERLSENLTGNGRPRIGSTQMHRPLSSSS